MPQIWTVLVWKHRSLAQLPFVSMAPCMSMISWHARRLRPSVFTCGFQGTYACIQGLARQLVEGAEGARDAAVETVRGRGKLHWSRYRAACRQGGAYCLRGRDGSTVFLCDFNAELTKPIQRRMVLSWLRLFSTEAVQALQ